MRLFLVDLLRCPGQHGDSFLVASTGILQDRHLLEGDLGCPTCKSRFKVRKGTAHMGDRSPGAPPESESTEESVTRLAALLALDSGDGVVLLSRAHARDARALREMTGVEIIQLDPPPDVGMGHGLSGIAGAEKLPLGAKSLRGAVLDAETSSDEYISGVVAALRPKARLIAPAATPKPDGVHQLARDERQWVAEKETGDPVITLRKA